MNNNFNLQRFIITIVIIGVILVLGIYITDRISIVTKDYNVAGSAVNETGAYINSTGHIVDQASLADFANPVLTAIYNTSDDVVIGLGNATISSAGVITNATVTEWADVYVSYTYTYTAATDASTASDNITSALATGTSWISIMVVVGFAVIILTMLTQGLGTAAKTEAATPYY